MFKEFLAKYFLKSTIRDIVFDQLSCECNGYSIANGYGGYHNIAPLNAYQYYSSVEPLRDAIDKISDAAAELPLAIDLKSDDKLLMDHPVLVKLDNPGDEVTKTNLLKELVISALLTNESWLILRGNTERPPAGISYVRPYDINVEGNIDVDGFPTVIRTNSPRDVRRYYKENVRGRVRYIDNQEGGMGLNELCPIIGTVELADQFRGLSPLTSLKYELEQIRGGNVHNASFLKNGMSPSKGFQADAKDIKDSGKTYPTGDQLDSFSESLRTHFSGAGKAGSNITFPFPVKVHDFATTNKDADYLGLMETAETRIYNQYGIPLAMISEKAMTLDNYTSALIAFFDNAVIDGSAIVFKGIANCLKARYKEDSMKLTFNPHMVKALQTRHIERMKKMRETQAFSTDEIRETSGREPVDGGEKVLVQGSLTALEDLDSLEEPTRFPKDIE